MKLRNWLLVMLAGLSSTVLWGQEFTGHITDSGGAAVGKALVTVHNQATGVDIPTRTTDAGDYTVPYLSPGMYSVSAEAPGFEKVVKTDINLEVGKTAVINLTLKVGSTAETVVVKSESAQLDLGKPDLGEVVENTRVTELPLDGGDPNMLAILNAGVLWLGAQQYQRPFDDTMWSLSVNGGGASNNELLLDGVPNENQPQLSGANSVIAYVTPIDSVQEFKIITNPYDAQYGRAGGGVLDSTLKSGTNKLHGAIYEYARRTFLDANWWDYDWYIAQGGSQSQYATPRMKWDQYGAELGGPLVLPKVYNGRNKAFFLMQYENFHEDVPNTIVTSVPDPAWANGDFSNLTWWNGTDGQYEPIIIYDPRTLHDDGTGNLVRDPFPGNIIPTDRLNPVAQKIMSYYPKPNLTPQPGENSYSFNYITPAPDDNEYRNVLGKLDWVPTTADRFTLRYGYWERVEYSLSNGINGPAAQGAYPHGQRSHTFGLSWTHTFSPSLLLDFRAMVGVREDYTHNGPGGFDQTTVGWPTSMVSQFGQYGTDRFPLFNLSEFASVGTNLGGASAGNNLSLFPSVTWVKGKHTVHTGIDLRLFQYIQNLVAGGIYLNLGRGWTQQYYGTSTQNSGNSFAELLTGTAESGGFDFDAGPFMSQHYFAPFVQDDWKVTPKLTLNLGVRWDMNVPATERHDRMNYVFDTTSVNPVDSQVNHAYMPNNEPVKGGITFVGVNGNPRSLWAFNKWNVQPRIGFAYAVSNNTVIRGGFGSMFSTLAVWPNQTGFSAHTNYIGSYDGGKTPLENLSLPFTSLVQPVGSSEGLATSGTLGQGPSYFDSHHKDPRDWQLSLGLQQQLTSHDTFEMDYVGKRGRDYSSGTDINPPSEPYYANCNPELGGNAYTCWNDYRPNPFYGVSAFAGSGLDVAPTIWGGNLTRSLPAFSDISESLMNQGRMWYNALQVTAIHKWDNGLTAHAAWTWSKVMEASGQFVDQVYRTETVRDLRSDDRAHVITLSGVYMLPVGRGRRFLGSTNRVLDGFIGGWEFAPMYIYQTGAPWAAPGNGLQLHSAWVPRHIEKATGYIRGAAACALNWVYDNGGWVTTPFSYNYPGTCNQPDFRVQAPFGPLYNNIYSGVRVPGGYQFDTNLSKNFQLVERVKLQVRVEAFNVLNHPEWEEQYDNNLFDPNFGTIPKGPWGQSNLPRQVQLVAKITW